MRARVQEMVCEWAGIRFPYASLGNIDTLHCLLDSNELGIFEFYQRHAGRYSRVLDIGANRGLHSIMMARCGWSVRAFEPDDEHFKALCENTAGLDVAPLCAAVSTITARASFVRVLGNTTGNHLEGCKAPYGTIQNLMVPTVDCRPLFEWADFAKIDVEGHEAALLETVGPHVRCEFMVEVGSPGNARAIYSHFYGKRALYAQRSGWGRVSSYSDMPKHHTEGNLYIA
jgi:FkbM family methyltransferase